MSLAYRTALITGAGGAIGGALARAFRREMPDLRLILSDRRVEDAQALAADLNATVIAADLSDPAAVKALIEAAGPVDVLVNNAGFMDVQRFLEQPAAIADGLLQVNLHAPLALMRGFGPAMVAQGSGHIINIASLAGVTPLQGCALYGATKAGLGMASDIIQAELAPRGVKVLTVYPGLVKSPLEAGARAQLGKSWLARLAPAGDPAGLAKAIVQAMRRDDAQLSWPQPYAFALRSPRLARRLGRWLWPAPRT